MAFHNITGHRHLLDLMARAGIRGTLPPSLIFGGPEGVGKRMAAVALAQLMNCLSPVRFGAAQVGGSEQCIAYRKNKHISI